MPVFNAPITTDDRSLTKVLQQKLPVLLYLYDRPDTALDSALNQVANEHAGAILVTRINTRENPRTQARYGNPALPALFTLDEGQVESRASRIRPADIEDHANFLLGMGPKPLETAAETEVRQSSGAAPVHTTDGGFGKDVLQSDIPVLVDFWAPWCGPCHAVAPTLEKVAQKYAGQVKVAKVNVDENPRTAQQYQTFSIPTLILFKGGQIVGKLVGAHPQSHIEQLVQRAL